MWVWRGPSPWFLERPSPGQEDGRRTQLIGQAELLPVLLAQEVWRDRWRDRRVLLFVDNDSARHALIRGTSPAGASAAIVGRFWESEASYGAYTWIERVPSVSNPADAPSRLEFGPALKLGAHIVPAEVVLCSACLGQLLLG